MIRPNPIVLAVGRCFDTEDDFETAQLTLAEEDIELLHSSDQHGASLRICEANPAVVMIDLSLTDGSPLAVADFCNYRRPSARVILLGGGELMADGSLFGHVGNAAAMISGKVPRNDLIALVSFHAGQLLTPA